TAGAVGVVAPIISSGVSSTTGKSSDQQWISIHHFTLALANSDDEVPPYTAIPMLSEDNNTLTVNVNEGLALSEIAIVTDSAIPSGDTANWEFESANVTVAGGNLTATKAGYYNGKVTVGGKTLDIIIAVKAADGELNTILSAENGFEYITEAVDVDLAKYTLLVGGKYFAADEVTVTPEENSGITVAGGKLTAANTGYFTVTYTTAQGELAIVYAVKGNTDKYYKSDNFKFQMSADYIGAKNKYGTGGWNDNILISVDRTDSKAPYSQVLIVPDRIYNHYVEGDWVNIYTVGDSMYSGDYAKSTKALIIEKYIEKIGGYAFANFVNAESVELPERLKELGANAFENNAKLMEVTLPATLTKIGANAFAGCTSLSHVWVMNPDAVTIGAGAFPEGVTVHVIGGSDAEAAFQAAGYTTEALETTKANAFKAKHDEIMAIEAARATTVDVGTWYQCNNTQWKEHKGLEFYRFALSNRDAGVLHVPATIEWTDDKGVTDTYALTQPYINAFSLSFERDRIYEIVFPQIGYQFQMGICEQMSNLKKVTLPSGLTNLSQYDFYGTAIEEIVIPATVRNIDYNGYVFGDCTNLKSITFEDASRTAVFGSNNLSNSQVETLDLPVSVENVNRYVAKQATNLKRINFYNKDAKLVKNSSYEADDSANYFTEVAAGFTIGCVKGGWMDAYAKKYNIPVVYLDDQLENKDNNPDNYVITKNGNVNSITDYFGIGGHLVIPSSGNTAEEKNVPVYSITNTAFKYYLNKIRSVELSEGIISIGESAFANTPNLKSVKLPTSLKTIAKEAFLNSGITGTLEIPKNVATISNSAFAGNSGITDVYFYNAATVIGSDSIPETATIHGIKGSTAETYAEKMSMKFVEIPAPSKETAADVTDNKNYKFTIDENGVLTGYERVDDNKAYSLKVTIPAEVNGVKVTAIGANIFDAGSESSSVYAIEIAEGITAINDNAFKDNLKLTHVKLPKTLEKIGESAFEGTMLIGELEFGETFKDLGKNAFKGVNTLTSVTILNKACLIKSAALPRGVKTFTLYGYYNSTAMNFASRNSITFVSLDGEPSDTPSDEPTTPGDENVKDPTDDNVKDPIDEPGDIGEEPQDTIIYQYIEEDLTMVIILAVAMLGMMLLMGGGLIILVIIKTRQ
ncbi:MAG: leucine-rich repeat domain-containing protein, partial [Clostridia bacterium]|nr:leucine-rich repeat domain-containing protein [Clostridia bacterium]